MPDPFPDPPISTVEYQTIVGGHRLIYLGPGSEIEGPSLMMDWVPADGSSRVWEVVPSGPGQPDPLGEQGAERTFLTINGDIQVVHLGSVEDPASSRLTDPLVMGFRPSTRDVRIWALDRVEAHRPEADVDYLLPKVNDSEFTTIGPGHELIYLDHDQVLDRELSSGHARVWELDRERAAPSVTFSTKDPLPVQTAEATFELFRADHQLVYLGGDTLLDRERSTGSLKTWRYDRTIAEGDFIPDLMHDELAPGRFAPDEQLVYIGQDLVLALATTPTRGVARVFEYDRIATEDPLQLALEDVAERALPWVAGARAMLGAPGDPPPDGVLDSLLERHFRYRSATIGQAAALERIRETYREAEKALTSMSHVKAVTKKEMVALLGGNGFAATVTRGFPTSGTSVGTQYRRYGFTGGFLFEGAGDEMRAGIMVHEAVHFVDPNGDDTASEAQDLYFTMPADQAIHNPSTYATFARHLFVGEELRFGLEPWR